MDEHYDVIILGTGLKECILSGLLSVSGRKVLHIDRNDYYGAESASFNLQQIKQNLDNMAEEDARAYCQENAEILGRSKDYNIDMCPKFIMGDGLLVKMLLHTNTTKYMEFKSVDGSYVFQDNKLNEVPVTAQAALNSPLMGMFQKRRFKNFLQWVIDVDRNDPSTWYKKPIDTWTPAQLYDYWKVSETTQIFCGHAIALYSDDSYKEKVEETFPLLERMQLYARSIAKFDKSPYIYPMWGLGGLPEGFSRLAAVHGGVYMLRRSIESINYHEDGRVAGITCRNEMENEVEGTATCDLLVGDPSYFFDTDKVVETGFVARWICILSEKFPGTKQGVESCQLIFPSPNMEHPADIYVTVVNKGLECAPQERWVVVMSTRVETQDEEAARAAFAPTMSLIEDKIVPGGEWLRVRATYAPQNQEAGDNIFICSSMDAATHFQRTSAEVKMLFEAITGEELVLNTSNAQDTQ